MDAMKELGFRMRLLLAVCIDYLFNHDADYAQS